MKLNIGGQKGKNQLPSGWKIIDTRKGADVCMDISEETLPFSNNSIGAIYTSHTLEHIFPDKLLFVLSECNRVLKEKGIMRVVVPNIDIAIKAYVSENISFLKDTRNPQKMNFLPSMPIYFLSSWFFSYREGNPRIMNGHLNVFNKQSLFYYLSQSGFVNIVRRKHNKCSRVFKGCDFGRYKNCSLYVECQKTGKK